MCWVAEETDAWEEPSSPLYFLVMLPTSLSGEVWPGYQEPRLKELSLSQLEGSRPHTHTHLYLVNVISFSLSPSTGTTCETLSATGLEILYFTGIGSSKEHSIGGGEWEGGWLWLRSPSGLP